MIPKQRYRVSVCFAVLGIKTPQQGLHVSLYCRLEGLDTLTRVPRPRTFTCLGSATLARVSRLALYFDFLGLRYPSKGIMSPSALTHWESDTLPRCHISLCFNILGLRCLSKGIRPSSSLTSWGSDTLTKWSRVPDLLKLGELGTYVTSAFARAPSHALFVRNSRFEIHAVRSCGGIAYLQVKICDSRTCVGTYR